jgi:UDP-N-acetylmuramoyl-L-alanyl-D-glutamate--2,6-diaminopimelate ligase
MFKEGILDKALRIIRRFIPKSVFSFFQPFYHRVLSYTGALRYGFPSRKLKVIGVTGTKGKSTVVHMTSAVLEGAGFSVAAIGSLGYKIKDKTWPNTLKMTMPGRWKIHKFLRQAVRAGCTYVVMEVPSEGLAQGRHLGVRFDCAVFTNLHPEHLEAHGSYEKYQAAKGILFAATTHMHVINADDVASQYFAEFPAQRTIFYGIEKGDMRASDIEEGSDRVAFTVYGTRFELKLGGRFNMYNALAALAVGAMYGVDLPTARPALESITEIPGRIQWIQKSPFGVVVDYAHTPDSLEAVYRTLKSDNGKLICVLGAAGGGRDKWKRKKFGALAEQYCDRIILTNEDPYDENPEAIVEDVAAGITGLGQKKTERIMDRREAIAEALTKAQEDDIVVITGKGSETSMALANGKKIPWSDAQTVRDCLQGR